MGCLKRYTSSVDGTIPVQALLYDDEDLLASQESVGIYDGYVSNIMPVPQQSGPPMEIADLLIISKWAFKHYAGLFTSSPKVTFYLHPLPVQPIPAARGLTSSSTVESGSWQCEVCNNLNPPGLSPTAPKVCTLCGVPQESIKSAISGPLLIPTKSKLPSSLSHPVSTSLPSSSANLTLSSSVSPSPQPGLASDSNSNGEIPCPACTFLNHPSLPACEICGTNLPRPKDSLTGRTLAKSAPSSRPTSPSNRYDSDDEDEDIAEGVRLIRVSFRKGGDKPFYAVLRRSLLSKAWESNRPAQRGASSGGLSTSNGRPTMGSGIDGLIRTAQNNAETARNDMSNALQDLEALMIKAKDMVRLASDLNERLTAVTASASNTTATPSTPHSASGQAIVEPEEATFIRSSLSQLGLQMTNAPVTLDMIKDERKWFDELARELAGVLQGTGASRGNVQNEGIMKKRGIIGLDEVWGGWNRARGVAMIPPSTLLSVLPHLPAYTTPPVHMRTFSNGLSVLHTPPYTRAAFASRMVGLLSLAGPRTTVELAQEEQLPIALVQEMIYEVEDAGVICRDEGGGGVNVLGMRTSGEEMASREGNEVQWWANLFREYEWDGQIDESVERLLE